MALFVKSDESKLLSSLFFFFKSDKSKFISEILVGLSYNFRILFAIKQFISEKGLYYNFPFGCCVQKFSQIFIIFLFVIFFFFALFQIFLKYLSLCAKVLSCSLPTYFFFKASRTRSHNRSSRFFLIKLPLSCCSRLILFFFVFKLSVVLNFLFVCQGFQLFPTNIVF